MSKLSVWFNWFRCLYLFIFASTTLLMFHLANFCLTTCNLPWFMDLTFQVPLKYCSLQHHTLFLSPVTSTTECCFCFGSISSFFLELFLHWSPVAYWAPIELGSSSLSVLSFCLIILFMGISRQGSVQFSSVVPLCPTLCDPWIAAHQASLSITNSRSLLKLLLIE